MAKGMSTRSVQFEGIGANYTTYINDPDNPLTSNDIGKPVVITKEKTVGLGWDEAEIIGILMVVEDDGFVTVQDAGYKEDVPFAFEPSLRDKVVTDGQGRIKSAPAGKGRHTVVSKDLSNQTVTLKLD